jgi:hypothetical protein
VGVSWLIAMGMAADGLQMGGKWECCLAVLRRSNLQPQCTRSRAEPSMPRSNLGQGFTHAVGLIPASPRPGLGPAFQSMFGIGASEPCPGDLRAVQLQYVCIHAVYHLD